MLTDDWIYDNSALLLCMIAVAFKHNYPVDENKINASLKNTIHQLKMQNVCP